MPEDAPPTETPTIIQLLSRVMADVGAVRKDDRNTHQGFNFRGVDAVVQAVYPALVRHGVIVVPRVLDSTYRSVEVGAKRTAMGHVQVTVEYVFHGPWGDSITARVCSEAMDSGDKAVAKAMSVAFRTALLQTLCLPTDDPDPDSDSYARAGKAVVPPVGELHDTLRALADEIGKPLEDITAKTRSQRGDIGLDEFMALPAADIHPFVEALTAYVNSQRNKKQEETA